jgi:PIN domain nuclease of toxin-antitoxin system
MKLPLDTHILLWYLANDPKLPETWKLCIEDRHNCVAVSVARLWEIAIKVSLGKLELMDDLSILKAFCINKG